MPGVPSGRGCDACRKQKKKCDQQPICSRCSRLDIPCIGSGQKRFKFKEQNQLVMARSSKSRSPVTLTSAPVNRLTILTNAFISNLEIKDLRYDLGYYGTFINLIPSRLGQNDALDASVSALTTVFSSLHTSSPPAVALESYVTALKTLRLYLSDPIKAREPNTLCAIYLIMITQGWIGSYDDRFTGHGQILAHLLNQAIADDWQGEFENQMLFTLCVPVMFESMGNPKIKLNMFLDKMVAIFGTRFDPKRPFNIEEGPIVSLSLPSLARLPEYVRDPLTHLTQIQETYDQMTIDCQKIRKEIDSLQNPTSLALTLSTREHFASPSHPTYDETKLYTRYQVGYGILLAIQLILNCVLRIFTPHSLSLHNDRITLTKLVLELAEQAAPFRPLGASYMPLSLAAAWMASEGTEEHANVEIWLVLWRSDFLAADWVLLGAWLKTAIENLREEYGYLGDGSNLIALQVKEENTSIGSVSSCCIL